MFESEQYELFRLQTCELMFALPIYCFYGASARLEIFDALVSHALIFAQS